MVMEKMLLKGEEEEKRETTGAIICPLPCWKLYDNPFFNHTSPIHDLHHNNRLHHRLHHRHHHNHKGHNNSHSHIMELKAELDVERRLRKKMESLNIALARELTEERRRREMAEKKLEDLSDQVSRRRVEMEKLRSEVMDERRMMRVAEVLREERVHMKLLEAKFLMEEKLVNSSSSSNPPQLQSAHIAKVEEIEEKYDNSGGNVEFGKHNSHRGSDTRQQQKRREMENPHIKRGIIGYVEFPSKLVRSRAGDLMGSFLGSSIHPKLELQKRQLRVLLKNNNRNRVIPLGGH